MTDNLYRKLSEERKKMQADGVMPEWFTTGGWQLFKSKYLYQASNPKEQYMRIARTLAAHTKDPNVWADKFFDIIWKGWVSLSTPILSNTGTSRGLPVSCAGSYMEDSIHGIYEAKKEVALLTKYGFGTASYLGDIRPRGAEIFGGGKSSGILPIIEGIQKDMEYVSQGTARRGSWAGYVPVEHGDFDEVVTYLEQNPDGNNIGWNISDEFIDKLQARDFEALRRYAHMLKTKMVTGKGYFFFPDKANAKRPQWYVDKGLDVKSSQLCVTGDTIIRVSTSANGEFVDTTMHDVVSRIQTEDLWVETLDADGNASINKVLDGALTGYAAELVTITTSTGYTITVTRDHGIRIGGQYVPAEQVNVGDVLDLRHNGVSTTDTVISVKVNDVDYSYDSSQVNALVLTIDGAVYRCLPNQLIETDYGRVEARELLNSNVGKIIIEPTTAYVKPVYDITVDTNHNFFANNINVSNCAEIVLHSSAEFSFTCVLASMNVIHWDELKKNPDAIQTAIVLLDCTAQEFIERAKNIKGLEKAVAFTRKSRALGLGVCGLHSLFQSKMIPFDSFDAHMLNQEIFRTIRTEAEKATKQIAEWWGEPEWCKGYNRANSHVLSCAPTKSCIFYDVKFLGSSASDVIDYYEYTKRGGLDLDEIMSVSIELEDGTTRILRWDDEITIIRDGNVISILGHQLQPNDDIQ